MDVPFDAGEDAESEDDLRPDGGSSSLGWATENAESTARSALDALPGRVVFAGGAAAGSVLTLLCVAVYTVYF